jgi:phage terminase Nu1 subunit (DNA packaging protein)
MASLFGPDSLKNELPPVVTKAQFADLLGVSRPRVTQLVAEGCPVTPEGRIPRDAALAWYEREKAPNKRRALRPVSQQSARDALDAVRLDRERLALERERGALVDRQAVERALFARGRADRDAWIGWASRIATPLAAELGADPAATFAALDRLVREHLAERAETPLTEAELDG